MAYGYCRCLRLSVGPFASIYVCRELLVHSITFDRTYLESPKLINVYLGKFPDCMRMVSFELDLQGHLRREIYKLAGQIKIFGKNTARITKFDLLVHLEM